MHFGKMYLLHINYHQHVLVIFVTIIKMSQRILIKHTVILICQLATMYYNRE